MAPRKKQALPKADPTVLGPLLVEICRLHHMRAHTVFEGVGVYRGQPPVLEALWQHDGLTHIELANLLHVKPATMTRMVQRMENAGLLERRPDPTDQRVSRVYLTPAGHEIRAATKRAIRTIDFDTFGGLKPEECSTMLVLLQRIRDNLLSVNNMDGRMQ